MREELLSFILWSLLLYSQVTRGEEEKRSESTCHNACSVPKVCRSFDRFCHFFGRRSKFVSCSLLADEHDFSRERILFECLLWDDVSQQQRWRVLPQYERKEKYGDKRWCKRESLSYGKLSLWKFSFSYYCLLQTWYSLTVKLGFLFWKIFLTVLGLLFSFWCGDESLPCWLI